MNEFYKIRREIRGKVMKTNIKKEAQRQRKEIRIGERARQRFAKEFAVKIVWPPELNAKHSFPLKDDEEGDWENVMFWEAFHGKDDVL